MKRMDEQVTVYETFAVITGVVEMRASIAGKEKELCNRYSNVWQKADGNWRMVSLAIDTCAF